MRWLLSILLLLGSTREGCAQDLKGGTANPEQGSEQGPTVDWPRWGGPGQAFAVGGVQRPQAWGAAGPTVLWRQSLGPGNSSVVTAEGRVFVSFRKGSLETVRAVDAATGERLWQVQDDAPARQFMDREFGFGPHSTPSVSGRSLYYVGGTAHLLALDAETGAERWRVRLWEDEGGSQLERGYAASPLVLEDRIIVPVGGDGQAVAAYSTEDGRRLWGIHSDDAAYSSPVLATIAGRKQVVVLLKNSLVGIAPDDGALLWQTPINSSRYAICSTPIVHQQHGVLTISSRGAELHRVRCSPAEQWSVERSWSSRLLGSQDHNILAMGERVLGSKKSTTFSALDLASGKAVFQTRELGDASHILVGNVLVSLAEDGQLTLSRLENDGPVPLCTARVLRGRCWALPAWSGGRLFLRDNRSLVALKL